jgi:cell division protein ZapD
VIVYEYPINERTRTYLRLEHLFLRFNLLAERDLPVDHHFALTTLFEVIEVSARAELKSDLMRDLDKQKQAMTALRGNPAIAEGALEQVIAQLGGCYDALYEQNGKAGQSLSDNDWLKNVRSRSAIPGGTCEFDLPGYFAWQNLPAAQRQADLIGWASCLNPYSQSVHWLLKLIRDAGSPQKVMAIRGQFQQTLPQARIAQLMRLRIDPTLGFIPEISGNRLMVSVRMMTRMGDEPLHAADQDVSFEMSLCS